MISDESRFFEQATLEIFSSLDVETALWRCLRYLSQFIPAQRMGFYFFDEDKTYLRTYAEADMTGGKKMERIIPIPDGIIDEDKTAIQIFNRPEEEPFLRLLQNMLGLGEISVLALELRIEDSLIGMLAVGAYKRDQFTPEHAQLLKRMEKPFAMAMANVLRFEEVMDLKNRLADENRCLQRELHEITGSEVIGGDSGLREVMKKVRKVAPTPSPVLLTGETGVGKEVIANAIHYSSPRKDGPFVKVNCGAIPESLIDSELFGHEKGAFTGATAMKRGLFERAHKGTLFLDEIGELPLHAQVRMLRVLQNKEIERVGGVRSIPVDIRIIAATHRDLEKMVHDREFREDLWFRLNIFPIRIPPLRERKGDIRELAAHFIEKKSKELRMTRIPALTSQAIDRLESLNWPGNVRELENLIERALIQNRGGDESALYLVNDSIFSQKTDPAVSRTIPLDPGGLETGSLRIDDVMGDHIRRVLKITKGKVQGRGGAAEFLDINPNTLRARMKKLGISYGRKYG